MAADLTCSTTFHCAQALLAAVELRGARRVLEEYALQAAA